MRPAPPGAARHQALAEGRARLGALLQTAPYMRALQRASIPAPAWVLAPNVPEPCSKTGQAGVARERRHAAATPLLVSCLPGAAPRPPALPCLQLEDHRRVAAHAGQHEQPAEVRTGACLAVRDAPLGWGQGGALAKAGRKSRAAMRASLGCRDVEASSSPVSQHMPPAGQPLRERQRVARPLLAGAPRRCHSRCYSARSPAAPTRPRPLPCSLNVLGCHRLTPAGKAEVAHLLDGPHSGRWA